mmetsp:Transcript_2174/g.5033  ORF Transcript_2174/g.5033 Transcript_2174/m.5033 type:complete len:270 (+) Transcript_2174:69-878(+)|eukprot:CAMPEP_0170613686 /NCGR_PEP_ID=MMETSP0224-20130122/24407_1 /TAXON_ID=285029 /ORGANISM="Togula jolla, Strain CCCM 725" /LENGTH=269 /DNA_ID=CAMNT_0010939309 /DNA_START=62 /DNA_END=871 /DNA_ORIENTATION=+
MAAPSLEVRILCDLGAATGVPDWLECEDAFGIFYYSRLTKAAALELPAEVRKASVTMLAAPLYAPTPQASAPQAAVLMRIGHWVIAEDELGVFYQSAVTLESFDEPPPELVLLLKRKRDLEEQELWQQQQQPLRSERQLLELQLRQKWEQQCAQRQQLAQLAPQQIQPLMSAPVKEQPLNPTEDAVVKMRVANWAVAQDTLGEFYQNMLTGEAFDDPPPELLRILKQRIGATPTRASVSQNMPTWSDLASEAHPQYRSWPAEAMALRFG